jgi:hypothetical protein
MSASNNSPTATNVGQKPALATMTIEILVTQDASESPPSPRLEDAIIDMGEQNDQGSA